MTTFGRDISCTDGGIRSGRFVTGPRLVAEAIYRRLTTRRGLLRGGDAEANYGIDLSAMVGAVQASRDAASLPGRIEAEIRKDERIVDVHVDVLTITDVASITYRISIDADTGEGPFSLVLDASGITTEILQIQAGEQ